MDVRPPERPLRFDISIPPDLEAGVYANLASTWHTAYEFTLDFLVGGSPRIEDEDDPDSQLVVACRLVARIKLPVALLFDLMRRLNEELTRYEAEYGEIRDPGDQEADS